MVSVLEESEQSIWLLIFRARTIREHKIETIEEKGPPSLSRVETPGLLHIFQIFMVRPNQERVLGPLKPMPPLFQGHLDCQKLPITHIIIPFSRRETRGEEGARVEFAICKTLGEDRTHCHIRSINFNNKRETRVR